MSENPTPRFRLYIDWDGDGFDTGGGVNVVTGGTFALGTTGWTSETDGFFNTGVGGGALFLRLTSGTFGRLYQNTGTAVQAGQRVRLRFTAANVGTIAQTFRIRVRDASSLTGAITRSFVLDPSQAPRQYTAEVVLTHSFADLRVDLEITVVTPTFSLYLDDVQVIPYALDDVTHYVQSADISLGNMDPILNVAQVGQATIVVDNSERHWSTHNNLSPLWGKLRLHLPVAIEAERDDWGAPVRLFTGILKAVTPDSQRYGPRLATLVCEDLLGALQAHDTLDIPVRINQFPHDVIKLITSATFEGGTASSTLSQSSTPTNGQIIRLGQRTYRFVNTLAQAYDVKIAPDLITQADNLAHAVNAGPGAGTAYHASTLRNPDLYIDRGQRARIHIPATLESSINRPEVGNNNLFWQAQRIVPPITGRIGKVRLWVAEIEAGALGSTIICEVRNEVASKPGGVLLGSALATGTAGADYIEFNLFSSGTQGVPVWLVFRSTTPFRYFLYGSEGSFYPDGWWLASDDSGANWGAPQDYDLRMEVFFGAPIVARALTEGAWGNSLVTTTTTTWNMGGGTLTGGFDAPVGGLDLQADDKVLDLVGGEWLAGETNAMTAIQEVCDSVGGFFWVARDGAMTYRPLDWFLLRTNAAPALTIDNAATFVEGTYSTEDIVNVISASLRDRRRIETGILAEGPDLLTIPGRWGETPVERWSKFAPRDPGALTIRLPYINPDTGKHIAALAVNYPIASQDYEVNDRSDFTGFDYTTHGLLTFSIVPGGADMEVTINNHALGTLYMRDFVLRGRRFSDAGDITFTVENESSIAFYGRRAPYSLMLSFNVSLEFARSYARYVLSRFAHPRFRALTITFDNPVDVGGVSPFTLDIGETVELVESQMTETQRYVVLGVAYTLSAEGTSSVTYAVRPLEAVTYWILGDPEYGKIGQTARLGV